MWPVPGCLRLCAVGGWRAAPAERCTHFRRLPPAMLTCLISPASLRTTLNSLQKVHLICMYLLSAERGFTPGLPPEVAWQRRFISSCASSIAPFLSCRAWSSQRVAILNFFQVVIIHSYITMFSWWLRERCWERENPALVSLSWVFHFSILDGATFFGGNRI